jgi:MtN3 and saliva related transmembrane protein
MLRSGWRRARYERWRGHISLQEQASGGTKALALHSQAMSTAIGLFAAFCTTVSYVPQLKKCWDTGSTGDLSLKTFLVLSIGIAAWVVYGILQKDIVIIIANSVSFCLLLGILYFKLRNRQAARGVTASARDGLLVGD